MKKKGQLKLSFGMIFSIFLIIIFLSVAVYAIIKFIDMQKTIQVKLFMDNLQADVNQMWQSQQGSQTKEYSLPNSINAVCFIDESQNLMFDSEKIVDRGKIEHIDIGKITSSENPYCIDNIGGKIRMIVIKEYGESLVTITRS